MSDQGCSERGRLRSVLGTKFRVRITGEGVLTGEAKRSRASRNPNEPERRREFERSEPS